MLASRPAGTQPESAGWVESVSPKTVQRHLGRLSFNSEASRAAYTAASVATRAASSAPMNGASAI